VTVTSSSDVYYDPYDFEIDADPYPVWKRLRDEAPLYWNEKYEFFALSRWDDVDAAMLDWQTYLSGRGSVLEIIKAGVEIPPGSILFEDPPNHDVHRSLLSRVFTPKKMQALDRRSVPIAPRCSIPSSERANSTSSRTWAGSCPCA
jgi:cytochrome P450